MSEFQNTSMPSAFSQSGVGRATLGGGAPAPAAAAPGRPSVIQLVFREKGALYAAYIPAFTDGGLFVPTPARVRAG
jgi:type IV pilus assembly protein PilZ